MQASVTDIILQAVFYGKVYCKKTGIQCGYFFLCFQLKLVNNQGKIELNVVNYKHFYPLGDDK